MPFNAMTSFHILEIFHEAATKQTIGEGNRVFAPAGDCDFQFQITCKEEIERARIQSTSTITKASKEK